MQQTNPRVTWEQSNNSINEHLRQKLVHKFARMSYDMHISTEDQLRNFKIVQALKKKQTNSKKTTRRIMRVKICFHHHFPYSYYAIYEPLVNNISKKYLFFDRHDIIDYFTFVQELRN